MRIIFLLLVCLLISPLTVLAQEDLIEVVSVRYSSAWSGLDAYRVKLKTDKISDMIARMTVNLPADATRPAPPELTKFWRRGDGYVIRATSAVMPTMEQMVSRFSEQFAVDLGSFFLPLEHQAQRAALLQQAKVKSADTVIGNERLHAVEVVFPGPTDIAGAFYGTSLDLPQSQVTRLVLDIDAQKQLLRQMVIETSTGVPLTVDIRHTDLPDMQLPAEIRITSPDGSIDDRFSTTFTMIDGFQLPLRQDRLIRRPGQKESFSVEFYDYVLETAPKGGK